MDNRLRQLGRALASNTAIGMDDELLELAREHRVDLVLADLVRARDRLRPAVAKELSASRDIVSICDAAYGHGVELLLMKGAALAYTHYAAPHLRPRDDIDLLVRRAAVERAEAMLIAIGYERDAEADAEMWTGQRHYVKRSGAGDVRVDLHWRAVNPLVFQDALAFDQAWPRSIPVPSLGPHARTLSPRDSLLLACLHRAAHHRDRVDLLWLWDIHLIASHMTADDLAGFAADAVQARAGHVCARGLALSREYFGTQVPEGVMRSLESASGEPSADFVGRSLSAFDVARADMAALGGWRLRAQLAREHLFPPASYMRVRYPRWPAALLPLAYVHRIVRGAPQWLRR